MKLKAIEMNKLLIVKIKLLKEAKFKNLIHDVPTHFVLFLNLINRIFFNLNSYL
jgi:hypothetical protein